MTYQNSVVAASDQIFPTSETFLAHCPADSESLRADSESLGPKYQYKNVRAVLARQGPGNRGKS